MIFYHYKSTFTQQESFQRRTPAFPRQTPSRGAVFNCYSQFHRARHTPEDEEGAGAPLSVTSEDHVTAGRTMVDEDARVMVVLIAEEVAI